MRKEEDKRLRGGRRKERKEERDLNNTRGKERKIGG